MNRLLIEANLKNHVESKFSPNKTEDKRYQINLRRFYFTNLQGGMMELLTGLNRKDFKNFINKQLAIFSKDDKWQFDHIIPVQFFDLMNCEEVKLCFHYSNIIPMLTMDNKKKGASVHFSKLLLEKRLLQYPEATDNINKLIDICNEEIKRYEKYL